MQLPTRKPGKYSIPDLDLIISTKKLDELKQDLANLKKKRPQAAKEVSRLAELGDFSENVEYQLAKKRLRGINSAILKLEYQIDHANIIKTKQNKMIETGHQVTIKISGQERKYQILGSEETNPAKGIISYTSPIGQALLGHKVGDIFKIKIAGKDTDCEIIKIN